MVRCPVLRKGPEMAQNEEDAAGNRCNQTQPTLTGVASVVSADNKYRVNEVILTRAFVGIM